MGDRAVQGGAVSSDRYIDNDRTELFGNVLRSIGRAVVADYDLAYDFRLGKEVLSLAYASRQRFRLVQARHNNAQLDVHQTFSLSVFAGWAGVPKSRYRIDIYIYQFGRYGCYQQSVSNGRAMVYSVLGPADKAATDALLCCNMIHIAPWAAAEGLFAGAARLLPAGAPLILYGPFKRHGAHTAPSNESFDAWLKGREPRWAVRCLDTEVTPLAARNGFLMDEIAPMPANNLTVIWRKAP